LIRKLLVANRGEIACRVFRAAEEMGIATVAVYSDADADAMHTAMADEKVHVGPSEPAQSYLDAQKIIDAAKQTGADAIHPGYGFLSERASFSELCAQNGIVFVGPPASAMRMLGDKISSKKLAVENGVPVTPGYFEPGASVADLKKAAKKIGFPVMLKASAGGGGRGMRAVHDPAEFERECALASEEALKAFGDGVMMVEKLVERPRHIEVQMIADAHGNVACLFERECSIQRRHQKVIEESPSPFMTDELWQRMREACIKLARAAGYVNAGTVEFMVDPASGEFYFLEVNARLQVEHPVTELVTGLDLVQLQLKIASGERLGLSDALMNGDRRSLIGYAIEARVISEDPARGFLPSVGKIVGWAPPRDPAVRLDTGFSAGSEVSRFYDSLIAKVIAPGSTREDAIEALSGALMDFHVLGVSTNIAYVLDVLAHAGFEKGDIDTGFLGREFAEWTPGDDIPDELGAIMALVGSSTVSERRPTKPSWDLADSWRVGGRMKDE
jgi:acetyl/propionyl-CoA carboxylase alpha subunit